MSRFTASMPASYFDALYAGDPDPWRFATSDYEREKYAATLTALTRARYAAALEIGCSIGVLTSQLAARCDTLLSLDVVERALAQARERCANLPHVSFARMAVPGDWPEGCFDLVVLSEVVYYLDHDDVVRLASKVAASVLPQADILLVHWLGPTNYSLSGDEAAECFIAAAAPIARLYSQTRTERYRLDLLRTSGDEAI